MSESKTNWKDYQEHKSKVIKIESEIVENYIDKSQDIPIGLLINYFLEEFPDSCFVENYNGGFKSVWNNEEILEEMYNVFRYEVLKWCGCGIVEASDAAVYKFLYAHLGWDDRKKILKAYFGFENIYDSVLLHCLAYCMDAAGFTEHGTSVAGAWTESRGKIYMYLLEKKYSKVELLDKEWH